MDSSPQNLKTEAEMAAAEIKKLNLEIKTLEWENSRLGRVARIATLLTILATIVTVVATGAGAWVGYRKFIEDHGKDRVLRARELTEKTSTQYRSDLQQLSSYPTDPKQTISVAFFIFQDLNELVENNFEEQDRERHRRQVGSMLSQLIRSDEYDLSSVRSVEFDRKALMYCAYYRKFLLENPGHNAEILSKYKFILAALHDENPSYYEGIKAAADYTFSAPSGPGKVLFFVHLFQGYQEHLALFDEALGNKLADAGETEKRKKLAFCWFQKSTNNNQLTQTLFHIDEPERKARVEQCVGIK
jgi:hypothetical protein